MRHGCCSFCRSASSRSQRTAACEERPLREVTIADPFIELHTGPGGGYPVFYVAERGEQIALVMRRTEWFKVRMERGQEGWVHFEQLTTTLNPDGEPFDLPELGFSDYEARRWEVGALYGDFGGANVDLCVRLAQLHAELVGRAVGSRKRSADSRTARW